MNHSKMNTANTNNLEMDNNIISSRSIIQFIYMLYLCTYYIMIYSCILMVNYMITNTYFNKKEKEPVASLEEEDLTLIRPVDEEDMETLEIYEFEGTGEQLRRLRAYNPKNDGETEEDYVSRIWNMAYKEDEEEEKIASTNEVVAEEQEVKEQVEEKRDVNTWHTIEDGKCRYKGEWKNGLPNGKGIKHFYKGDSYIDGNFVDGFAEGYGKQTYEQTWEKTQPYYEGEFKRNTYNGKGAYYYGDGDYYKGDWKDGKYHGQGAAYSLRLDRTWVGEYKNDEKVEGNWVRGEI